MPWLMMLKYWREIAIGLLVVILIGAGISGSLYLRSVFTERDQLKQANAVQAAQLKSAAAMAEMNNKIADAIAAIRIRSNVNVQHIESEPAPVFADARPIPFIPGGLPQRVYSSVAVAAGTVSGPAPGGALPAAEPTGGVLPH